MQTAETMSQAPQSTAWTTSLQQAWVALPFWEVIAVTLSLLYLIWALRENNLCWYAAFISTAIYTILFWDVQLLMDSALQIYYMVMAVYGWHQWRTHGPKEDTRAISTWPLHMHIVCLLFIALLSIGSGYWLSHNTMASWPYLDSFTTWASVATTVMVANKILENWLYWIIIDTFGVILYLDRELYLTALLFVAYIIIATAGFFTWLRHYRQHEQAQENQSRAEAGF